MTDRSQRLGSSFNVTPTSAYAVAVAAVLIAAGVRWALGSVLENQLPFTIFFAAVVCAAWYGGVGPGILAVALSFLLAEFLFIEPAFSLRLSEGNLLAGLIFVIVALSCVMLSGSLHRARSKAVHSEQQVRSLLAAMAADVYPLRRAEESARFLAEASRILAQSLDYSQTLNQVADLAVPRLADWCFVDLAEPDGTFRKVAIRCASTGNQAIGDELLRSYTPDTTRPHPIQQAYRTRHPELVSQVTDSWIQSRARDARHRELLRVMNLKSLMAIPLLARNQLLGVITLATAESGREYAQADLENAEALAIHIGLAISNSQLYHGAELELHERNLAERALRESEGRFRNLVTATGAMVWRVAPDGRAIDEPAGWEQVTGQPYAELVADPAGWFTRVHPADVARVQNVWGQAQASKRMVDVEFRLRRRDGMYRRMHTVGVPLLNESGSIVEWIGTTIDVHDRREAEERLQQAQGMETVGRLAGGMAHETNNQMMVVLSFTEFLLRGSNLTEEQRGDLQTMAGAAERVSALTRQLLALSRRQVLDTRVLELDSVVMEAEPALRRTLGPEIRLSVQFEPGEKWVMADRNQMVQIMVNLALNARDAISETGELTISTRRSDRGPAGGRLGTVWGGTGVALLSVADSGSGIDPSIQGRIFEPFFSAKPSGKGTGLGLSVVEGIVSQSGGDLWVESKPGYGTVVTIGLALTEAPVEEPVIPVPLNGRGGNETVLVVDDEEQVRRLLTRGLQLGDYRVMEASGGQEAIALLEQENGQVQVVVTDIAMPDMNGLELAARIRAAWPGLPVVLVSGHPYEVVVRDQGVIEAGRFLQKPFKVDTMLAVVRNALDEAARPV